MLSYTTVCLSCIRCVPYVSLFLYRLHRLVSSEDLSREMEEETEVEWGVGKEEGYVAGDLCHTPHPSLGYNHLQALYTDGGKTPYVGFTWYALDDGVCTRNVGHCPLMKSRDDLSAEFQSGKEFGAAAIVVWGSSGDVRNVDDCKELESYLETTLGPMLRGVV